MVVVVVVGSVVSGVVSVVVVVVAVVSLFIVGMRRSMICSYDYGEGVIEIMRGRGRMTIS